MISTMTALLLESAVRTFVLAVAAWAALRLLRVANVVAQKIAWTIVLAAAIAMPLLIGQTWVKLPPITLPASWTTDVRTVEPAIRVITPPPHEERTAAPLIDLPTPAPASGVSAVTSVPSRWTIGDLRSLINPVYLAVSGFLLLRLLIGLALAFRLWYRAKPASVLVDPRADVRFSEDIRTPVTIGLGIILPSAFQNWPRPRLHVVLAHERAHVRQADFYLQLLARLHTAIFWFSPAAWWIQKSLSDLGEAISDYAAVREINDAPSYAELLLEVAAIPRQPLFAVPMARSSRIERRVERILTDGLFRRAFIEHKGRALVIAAIIPAVLAASFSLLAVHAAEIGPALPAMHVVAQEEPGGVASPVAPATAAHAPAPPRSAFPEPPRAAAPPAPIAVTHAPVAEIRAPVTPSVKVKLETAVITSLSQSIAAATLQDAGSYSIDPDEHSFVVVDDGQTHMFNFHGDSAEMEALRDKLHGNYILTERGGKYYVIDDPALVEQSRKLIEPLGALGHQQEALGAQQEKLGEQQERLGKMQEEGHIDVPDMSKEIADLQQAMKQLQDMQKNKTVTQADLADIQGRIAAIEGRLGAMQGQIGEQAGEFGRQMGELGRQQGELGRKQGQLGREQGRLAREASRQINSMVDQAFKEGKAKPVQ